MSVQRPLVTTSRTASPAAGSRSAFSRLASHPVFRPTLSKKFVAFVGIVLLVMVANGFVVRSLLQERKGIAATINIAGSLRWLSQRTQIELQRRIFGLAGTRGALDTILDRFERQLQTLDLGGRMEDGIEVGKLPDDLRPVIESVRMGWRDYRGDIDAVVEKWERKQDVRAELDHIYQSGNAILAATDGIVGKLARRADAAEERALATLYGLALLDIAVVVIGFLRIRARVVAPLRRLAEGSRRFAAGNYGERVGFRSRDEIGQLAEAFDHLADETERHIRRIANDVLEIRRAEQSLRLLSKAVDSSPASVIITNRYGTIEYVNAKFFDSTGFAREDSIGQQPRMLKSGTTSKWVYKELWDTILSGREWRGELQNRKKNGELFWEATRISPVENEGGEITHFISVKEDITERKLAEEELRRLNLHLEHRVSQRTRQLEASNRELEAFSYSVSHDLRAPLRAVNGFAQILTERCAGCANTESIGYLDRIRKASVRMGELIDDLLRLSHVSRSELVPERVDLSEMARQITSDLAGRMPERRVEVETMDGVVVHGDARLLRIVLENLLGNAWKFSARRDVASIAFGWSEEGDERVIFVRDNGAGFDPRHARKLFSAFQRLHRSDEFDGSGIGLAIVQRIVSLHGGRIWAEAQVGQGAVFSFVLPEACEPAPKAS